MTFTPILVNTGFETNPLAHRFLYTGVLALHIFGSVLTTTKNSSVYDLLTLNHTSLHKVYLVKPTRFQLKLGPLTLQDRISSASACKACPCSPQKFFCRWPGENPREKQHTHTRNHSTKYTAGQKEHIALHRTVALQPGVFTSWYRQPRLTAVEAILIAHTASRYNIQFWWTHSTAPKKQLKVPLNAHIK